MLNLKHKNPESWKGTIFVAKEQKAREVKQLAQVN